MLVNQTCVDLGESSSVSSLMPRKDNRSSSELRSLSYDVEVAPNAAGSVLIRFGHTQVLCAATFEETVPRWMKDQGVQGGWLTAEYAMLPYSTLSRKPREGSRGKVDGRSTEIQRLIGRALRAAVDLKALGPRTLWVDCDVLQADGGTRTAAITGACVAVELACRKLIADGKLKVSPVTRRVAAVSVGVVAGEALLDLNYEEDRDAAVDMNLVMTDKMEYVELQGSGEEAVFTDAELASLLALGREGVRQLLDFQNTILAV